MLALDLLWRANLLDAAAIPNPETTGSAGFTMALAWGLRSGVLPRSLEPVLWAAWQGLATLSLQPDGMVGWCQPVGAAPAPATQGSTSDFCLGLWLLAAAEVYKLVAAVA